MDIKKILGVSVNTKSSDRIDEDDLCKTTVIDSIGREQVLYITNESGLYSLIIRSNKPEAKSFKRWITSEVLPSIRKN